MCGTYEEMDHDGEITGRFCGWRIGLGRNSLDPLRRRDAGIVVLPEGIVLRARIALLQAAASERGQYDRFGLLLSGLAVLLSRIAVL
jgi:hypothetical protein